MPKIGPLPGHVADAARVSAMLDHVAGSLLASAEVIRPAVMFGPDDAFLNALIRLLRRLPVYPMFGRGETQLQPADVEDIAEAAARLVQRTGREAITVEGGGRRVYSYKELLRTIARAANVRCILVLVPFAAWHALAGVAEMLTGAPVTRDRVELMQIDTVVPADVPGFADLGISPRAMEEVLQSILKTA
jgi:NADH dehydrogenase